MPLLKKNRGRFALLTVMFFFSCISAGLAAEATHRLGVPKGYESTPTYEILFENLANWGFERGRNLKIVPIDLSAYHLKAGKKQIRMKINQHCDLFFTTGNYLEILWAVQPEVPLLFISISPKNPLLNLPANATGIYRGTEADTFRQAIRFLPQEKGRKLGILYSHTSRLETRVKGYKKICAELDIELVSLPYAERRDLQGVMRKFKEQGGGGVILFPPAIRPGDLPELIRWQNELKLPLIGQTKRDIEQGLLAGPVINYRVIGPALADYGAKLLKGRSPSQLPVKYYNATLLINLATVNQLGLTLPEDVVAQAEITGLNSGANSFEQAPPQAQLKPGNFTLATPNTKSSTLQAALPFLADRGYELNRNLHLVPLDLPKIQTVQGQKEILDQIKGEIDLIYATGNSLPDLTKLPALPAPVCFVATRETAATIPDRHKQNFTGMISASWTSIFKNVSRIMGDTSQIGMLARHNSTIHQMIKGYQKTAAANNIHLSLQTFGRPEEIPAAMEALQKTSACVILFPPGISQEALAVIVQEQNRLRLPVLSKQEVQAKAGLLGGPVLNTDKLAPKLAEYIDKLLQGRSPNQLPLFYYPEKNIINLKTVHRLGLEISPKITRQATIIH